MRFAIAALMLPLGACVLVDPAPRPERVAKVQPAVAPAMDASGKPIQIAANSEPKTVCWMETVTGTRGRKQKVCKTEGYDRASQQARDDLKSFQDRAGNAGPPAIMGN